LFELQISLFSVEEEGTILKGSNIAVDRLEVRDVVTALHCTALHFIRLTAAWRDKIYTARYSTSQYGTTQDSTVQHGTVRYNKAQQSTLLYIHISSAL
jgi:hypothetical protein